VIDYKSSGLQEACQAFELLQWCTTKKTRMINLLGIQAGNCDSKSSTGILDEQKLVSGFVGPSMKGIFARVRDNSCYLFYLVKIRNPPQNAGRLPPHHAIIHPRNVLQLCQNSSFFAALPSTETRREKPQCGVGVSSRKGKESKFQSWIAKGTHV
jgi:hypothetical protein